MQGIMTETRSVADTLVELLCPWVGQAFNVAGAANVPFIVAWSARQLPWVTALEEKRGLTMAEGYVRASGRLALMTTTAGPGVTNLATALLLALQERSSVFVVTGQTPRGYATRLPVQKLDTKSFARDITLQSHELTAPEQLAGFVGELLCTALRPERPGPVLLAVPADMWQLPCRPPGVVRLATAWGSGAARHCADALRRAIRPLVVAGSGVVQAGVSGALKALVDLLPRARVVTTPRALGAFPSSDPRCAGIIGFGGGPCPELDDTDLVLVLGSRLHEMSTNFDDRLHHRRILHLDIDPHVPGRIYPAEGFCADLRPALRDLIRHLPASAFIRATSNAELTAPLLLQSGVAPTGLT